MRPSKPCAHCSKPIEMNPLWGPGYFKERKYCNTKCTHEVIVIRRLAKSMDVPYNFLKRGLIKIAEAYHG